jgi:LysR family glycine cleavage system transcriptional activator
MPRRLPPLNPLRAFEAAARHGGMTKAASELNVTHGAISHQVRALEEALSVELFERRGRHLALTLAGQQLLPSVQQALDLIADASARLSRPDLDGRLTIKLPIAFASKWLLPRLARFRDAYPQIELSLLPFRPGARERSEEADLTIDYGRGPWKRKWTRLIASIDLFPICSPRLINAAAPLRDPADLAQHTLIHDDDGTAWANWLLVGGLEGVDANSGIRMGTALLSIDAAVQGLGVALGDKAIATEELATGLLVRPFGLGVPATSYYYLVCDPDQLQVPRVRAFIDWLLDEAGQSFARAG